MEPYIKVEILPQVTKFCKCCKTTKTRLEFSNCKKSADALQTYCKVCKKKLQQQTRNKQKESKLHNAHVCRYYVVLNKRQFSSKWRKENPGLVKAQITKRKLKRSCCTWANKDKIKSIYYIRDFLNMCTGGIYYHVDHIIPLQGKVVSGLHVENNLAILLASENLRKNNLYETR